MNPKVIDYNLGEKIIDHDDAPVYEQRTIKVMKKEKENCGSKILERLRHTVTYRNFLA